MVETSSGKNPNINFETLAQALDSDPDFRNAVMRHLGVSAGGGQTSGASVGQGGGRNQVHIETRAHFALDDEKIFDLNGDGLKITVVATN